MAPWKIWLISSIVLILSEFIIPGAIVVFLGMAGLLVSGGLYFGWIDSVLTAFIFWFISSLFLMIFVRSIFVRYLEGDKEIHQVDEEIEIEGSLVEVVEEIMPYKEGRVRYRGSTWEARSDEQLKIGEKGVVKKRDGNVLVIKPI